MKVILLLQGECVVSEHAAGEIARLGAPSRLGDPGPAGRGNRHIVQDPQLHSSSRQ